MLQAVSSITFMLHRYGVNIKLSFGSHKRMYVVNNIEKSTMLREINSVESVL